MKSFSIITAVYNGAQYITNCVESIATSNYDLSKVEHIIVDDGSTDETRVICENLAKKYKHIKFFSKSNGNWGSVINFVKANRLVSNDYVVMCDADDRLTKNSFSIVNNKCDDSDIFLGSFYRWNGKKIKIKILPYFFITKKKLIKKYAWNYNTALICPQSAWIKKEIFYKTNPLEEGISYQDTIFFQDAFLLSSNLKYTTKATSLYWINRPGNSMSQSNNDKGIEKFVKNLKTFEQKQWINPFFFYVLGYKKIRKYLKKNKMSFSFEQKKIDLTGFPIYIRPIMRLLYHICVKKFIKK